MKQWSLPAVLLLLIAMALSGCGKLGSGASGKNPGSLKVTITIPGQVGAASLEGITFD